LRRGAFCSERCSERLGEKFPTNEHSQTQQAGTEQQEAAWFRNWVVHLEVEVHRAFEAEKRSATISRNSTGEVDSASRIGAVNA
jgi:hypothetical protein